MNKKDIELLSDSNMMVCVGCGFHGTNTGVYENTIRNLRCPMCGSTHNTYWMTGAGFVLDALKLQGDKHE